jgi:3-phosphoshikimate 1-carboxyvinyltransferase
MKAVNSSKISGSIKAPASKSVMIRATAASYLAASTSQLLNPSLCADSLAALRIVDTLGADVKTEKECVSIRGTGGLTIEGFKKNTIDCGESGLCMRMFTPIVGLAPYKFIIEGAGSLCSRPMETLEALSLMGGVCETSGGYPPVTISGPIRGGAITLDGSKTSQFLTGLLIAAPLCEEDTNIEVMDLKSKPYVEMTIDLLKRFGITIDHDKDLTSFRVKGNQRYEAQTYTIEGDWSGAAFLLVAGAIAGSIKMVGLRTDSFQADKVILDGLTRAGALVKIVDDYILVEKGDLRAFEFDATDCPDLVPPLTALAAHCRGKSVIRGIERLQHKESNRSAALVSEFSRLSIKIEPFADRMEIYGSKPVGNLVDSHNDHRIAMACAVASLNGERPVVIENYQCVAKSYPDFFRDIHSVQVIS